MNIRVAIFSITPVALILLFGSNRLAAGAPQPPSSTESPFGTPVEKSATPPDPALSEMCLYLLRSGPRPEGVPSDELLTRTLRSSENAECWGQALWLAAFGPTPPRNAEVAAALEFLSTIQTGFDRNESIVLQADDVSLALRLICRAHGRLLDATLEDDVSRLLHNGIEASHWRRLRWRIAREAAEKRVQELRNVTIECALSGLPADELDLASRKANARAQDPLATSFINEIRGRAKLPDLGQPGATDSSTTQP